MRRLCLLPGHFVWILNKIWLKDKSYHTVHLGSGYYGVRRNGIMYSNTWKCMLDELVKVNMSKTMNTGVKFDSCCAKEWLRLLIFCWVCLCVLFSSCSMKFPKKKSNQSTFKYTCGFVYLFLSIYLWLNSIVEDKCVYWTNLVAIKI